MRLKLALLIVALNMAKMDCSRQICFTEQSDVRGKSCNENVMLTKNVNSLLECLALCKEDCWSVFYSSSTKECHGCKGIYDAIHVLETLHNSVYYIKKGHYEYKGCYLDCQNISPCPRRVLDQGTLFDNFMTAEICANHCKEFGLIYFGTQNHMRCACGDNFDIDGPANNCDNECYGNSSQMCGGYSANSVYGFVFEC